MLLSKGEKFYDIVNMILLGMIAFICLYPFVYVLSVSLSNVDAVKMGKVWIFPIGFNLDAYKKVLSGRLLWSAYGNSFFYMIVGTFLNTSMTILAAYPLSKKRLVGGKMIALFILFTMWFKVPLVPFYLNIRQLGLENTRLGILLPFAISAFYVVILRTYFSSVSEHIEESAKIDGANDFQILLKIMLPISLPAIATVSLYYAVEKWNAYFWAMILLKNENLIPLQVLLKKMVVEMNISEQVGMGDYASVTPETFVYTTIVVAIIPMMMLYPFVQKYFVKGIMLGAVKG